MTRVVFITHPDVLIDPAVPVVDWPLSAVGRARMVAALAQPWVMGLAQVWCSTERKAGDAAAILADHLGVVVHRHAGLGENDRSATGFVPKAEFEALADIFFAQPQASVRGWERACDAQARIVAAVAAVLHQSPAGDVAIVAHGAVGALLLCALTDAPISRAADQPPGNGGHMFCFDRNSRAVVHGWRRIDA